MRSVGKPTEILLFFMFELQKKGQLMSWMLRPACGETQQILGFLKCRKCGDANKKVPLAMAMVCGLKRWKIPLVWWSWKGMCYKYQDMTQVWCQWPGRNATWMFHDLHTGIMIWLYTSDYPGLHLLALVALLSQLLCQAVPKQFRTLVSGVHHQILLDFFSKKKMSDPPFSTCF